MSDAPTGLARSVCLVCEDDPMVLSFFVDALRAAGYRVASAPDGVAALRAAGDLRPDVIVLDLAMPGLDGASVLTHLKADPVTAPIPVVIASAYPGWLTFLDRGLAAAVLEKPCLPDELEGAVALALAEAADPAEGR